MSEVGGGSPVAWGRWFELGDCALLGTVSGW